MKRTRRTSLYVICFSLFLILIGCGQGKKYQVGVTTLNLIDPAREEVFTEEEGDDRELMVKVWYPAAPRAEQEPLHLWFHTKENPVPIMLQQKPHERVLAMNGNSYLDAPMIPGTRFPVVLFSHSYNSFIEQNQFLMEELASQGYIVVSVGHTYQATLVTLSHGYPVYYDWDARENDSYLAAESNMTPDELDNAFQELAGKKLSPKEQEKVYSLLALSEGDRKTLKLWIADMSFVLDELGRINQNGSKILLMDSMDLSNVGAAGMGFGGATAAFFCFTDDRCSASVNMTGTHYLLNEDSRISKPYMMLSPDEKIRADFNLAFEKAEKDVFLVKVKNSEHMNFSDFSVAWLELKEMGMLGEIDGNKMINIMNDSVVIFFDNYLKKEQTRYSVDDALNVINMIPEVKVRYKPAAK